MIHRIRPLCLAFGMFLVLALAGCTKTGKLNEGNCKCSISFVDIPRELTLLEENVQSNFAIRLTLKNISNEKLYYITLNKDNDFSKEISLHPGIYQVYSLYTSEAYNTQLSVTTDAESIELKEDAPAILRVYVDNPDEFTAHWMAVQPMPEMLLADKFDGLIQVNRRIFNLRDTDSSELISQFDLNYDKDRSVPAYKKIEVKDSEAGVTLIMQNQTDNARDWRSCTVVGILVTKNNVVFPQGVTLGMAPSAVCHDKTGLYGAPDTFSGSLLYGLQLDETYAIYNDPESGDRITIDLGSGDSSIRSIRYELAQYEE